MDPLNYIHINFKNANFVETNVPESNSVIFILSGFFILALFCYDKKSKMFFVLKIL